jgi:hypothetical protein
MWPWWQHGQHGLQLHLGHWCLLLLRPNLPLLLLHPHRQLEHVWALTGHAHQGGVQICTRHRWRNSPLW